MTKTIELPRMARDAAVRAETFNEDERTVDMIWTTGARVRRVSWIDGAFNEELVIGNKNVRLDRLNAGAPFLNSHDSFSLNSVIGSVVPGSARIEKNVGVATVKLSGAPEDAGIVNKIRDGIIRNISVGYRIHKVEKIENDEEIPLMRVTDWEPLELSAVAIPADPGAQMRSAECSRYPCLIEAQDMGSKRATFARMLLHAREYGIAG